MTASIPIYTYRVILTDARELTIDAMSFRESEPWIIFDDTEGTVLTIRTDTIAYVQRGAQSRAQVVDELSDPIDPKDLA